MSWLDDDLSALENPDQPVVQQATPGIQSTNWLDEDLSALDYDSQTVGFKSPAVAKPPETEPEGPSFSNPPPGVSRAKYAWDKLGDMFAAQPELPSEITEGIKQAQGMSEPWLDTVQDDLKEPRTADSLIDKQLSINPFAPAPQTEVMPEDVVEKHKGVIGFADMYLGKAGKKLQELVTNDWNRASTHIAETYLKPPKFADAKDAQDYYVNNILDDVTAGIVKTLESVDGIVNFTANMPAFFGSASMSVAQASWKYMQNLNQDEWKLEDGELTNAAQYGMQQFNKLFESTSLKPLTAGGAEAIEIAMLPITEFAESISDYGQENGWSQGKIEASQYAFYMALAASPLIKSAVKSMPKTAAELVGRTKAKFGKVPITPEEASHYVDNFKKATKLTNQKRYENMMKNADDSAAGTLRNQVKLLGIEDLEAYKDGTLGGKFEPLVAEAGRKPVETAPIVSNELTNAWDYPPGFEGIDELAARNAPNYTYRNPAEGQDPWGTAKQAKLAEAAATVDATKGSIRNNVDHILNNHGVIAEALIKKGKHAEAENYLGPLLKEIEKVKKQKGFKAEVTPEQKAKIAKIRKLKKENDIKRAQAVSELEAEMPEVEVPMEEVPAAPVVKVRKKADKQVAEPEVSDAQAAAEAAAEAEGEALTVEVKQTDPFKADKSAEEVFSSVAARLKAKAKNTTLTPSVQNTPKPTKKKTVKKSKAAPEVETVNTALTHEMFKDKETTLSEAEVYNDPETAHSVSISPVGSMRKLVNDVNRFLHGDKGVDINLVADSLNNMQQEVNGYRGAFAKQEYFNNFYHEVHKAAEFADLAKWNEIDPKVERKAQDGITLSSGFDPSLIKSTLQEGIELSKKLVGSMKPSAARKFVAELGKTRELELSGLDAYLAQAEKEGRKVTREDLLSGMKSLDLVMEVDRNAYRDMGRAFPSNAGYENHIYKYAPEGLTFNEMPGHYGSRGSNQVFTTRVSRGGKGVYVLEEFQSDWWQREDKVGPKVADVQQHVDKLVGNISDSVMRDYIDTAREDSKIATAGWTKEQLARFEEILPIDAKLRIAVERELIDNQQSAQQGSKLFHYAKFGEEYPGNTTIPFRESWGKNAIGLEMMQAIAEGAKEFRVSTAETVLRGEGIINANQTIEGVLKNPGTSEYRKSTIRAIVDAYDKAGPKYIRQLMSRWGEKAEVERVEGSTDRIAAGLNKTISALTSTKEYITRQLEKGTDLSNDIFRNITVAQTRLSLVLERTELTDAQAGALEKAARYIEDVSENIPASNIDIASMHRKLHKAQAAIDLAESVMLDRSGGAYWRVKLPDSLHKKVQEKQVVPTVKLSSGLDPTDIIKEFTGSAKQMQGWFNHLRSQKDVPKTQRIADLSAKLQSNWIDTKAYAKKMLDQMNTKESYDAFKQLVLSAGSQTAGAMAIKRARKAIYKGTNKLRREMVDNVIFARRIIAIDEARAQEAIRTGVHKPVKHPKLSKEKAQELGFPDAVELDSKVAKQYLDQLELRLDKADFADIIRRSEIYFNVMRDQLKMLKDKGVISPQLYGRLVKWDYSKRQDIMDKLDPAVTHMIGREPITVRESGVVRLREGTNEDLLEIDSELLMADIVQAAHNRVFRNDTNLALREIAVKSPDNGLVKIPKTDKASPPRGWSSVELFINGKHKKLFLENDFARSWLVRNREVSFEIARNNQVISGSAILKPMATGINPEFAFANILRDLAHIWLTSQVKVGDKWVSPYSKHLPLALPQMAGDLAKVAHDTFTRRGRWIDAVQDGMGMQFLSHEGRVWRKNENIQSNLDLIQEAFGYLNESSEILSRLMVRERAMKNYAKRLGVDFKEFERLNELLRPEWKDGKMVEKPGAKKIDEATRKLVQEIRNEGSFIGRDYMDFSVHGSKGEFADTLIPYLNPGIQGTRGLFRAARRNPTEFATKLAYVTATAMTLYFMNRMNNEDGMKHISKQARLNNFIIMTNTKIKDANGVERYVYYTIPKDPSQRYFAYMIDKFMDKFVYGEEVDWPSVTEAVGSLFPISPDNVLGITPTGNAVLAFYGIDAWRTMLNKEPVAIWRQGELPDDQQGEAYIAGRGAQDTPQWAITLGKQFNMKPVEIQQIMGSYVTHTGNMWTWLSGKAFDEIFTDDADEARQEMFADLMTQYEKQNNLPMFRRFIGLTTSDTEQALEKDEDIIKEHTLNNWLLERKLNIAAQNYILGRGDLGDINMLKADYPDSHKKIDEEIKSVTTIMNPDLVSPSNRSFWQSMRKPGSNTEKAERYFARYQDAKDPTQLETERVILGYNTEDFLQEYARLLANGQQ